MLSTHGLVVKKSAIKVQLRPLAHATVVKMIYEYSCGH